MADPLPLYLNVDGVYEAQALALPWADFVSEGVITASGPGAPLARPMCSRLFRQHPPRWAYK